MFLDITETGLIIVTSAASTVSKTYISTTTI